MKTIRIASRASALAMWQAEFVATQFKAQGHSVSIIPVTTTGDADQVSPIENLGGKGVFVKEIQRALLDERADIAVHCLKDLPAKEPAGLMIAAYLERHAAEDVLITDHPFTDWQDLEHRRIATSSLRRQGLLQQLNRKAQTIPIRGNVDTRIKKCAEGFADGLFLAKASLDRLGLTPKNHVLDPKVFIPSPGQGTLILETRQETAWQTTCDPLDHRPTRHASHIERYVLQALGADCLTPLACHAHIDGEIRAAVFDLKGNEARVSSIPSTNSADQIGETVFQALNNEGAQDILRQLKESSP